MTDVLDRTTGLRAQGVEYEVTDVRGVTLGAVRGVGGSMSVTTNATRVRTLTGVRFDSSDLADVNPFTDWIRPVWVVGQPDGTFARYAMGLLTFVTDPIKHSSGLTEHQVTLHDGSALLDTPMLWSDSGGAGTRVMDLALRLIAAAGVLNYTVQDTDATFLDPVGNVGGTTTYRQMLVNCCQDAGWLPPWFDRNGQLHLGPAPTLDRDPDVTYTNARVINGTRVTNPNLLDAPNAHRVTSIGAVGTPITAIAFVDPSAPHSRENRGGRIIVQDHQLQGVPSQEQAETMARAFAAADPATFERVQFNGPADPRHDVFSVVRLNGVNYLETAWALAMTHNGQHSHTLQRSRLVGG